MKRKTAGFLAVLFLTLVIFSISFTALETHHDCSGEDCPICLFLNACAQTLRLSLGAAGAVCASALHFLLLLKIMPAARRAAVPRTIVSLKVKLTA